MPFPRKYIITCSIPRQAGSQDRISLTFNSLVDAERFALRHLRIIRLTRNDGPLWTFWAVQACLKPGGLPVTVAVGNEDGATYSQRSSGWEG